MPDRLFNRVVQITAWRESVPTSSTAFDPAKLNYSQVVVKDLRIEFKVEHTLRKHPNTCDVTITNLAADTRTFLEQKPVVVQLAAGYDNKPRLMYTGDVRFAMTELKSPDWKTLLQLGDGDCNHQFARVNRSYKQGTTIRQVVSDAVKSFGYAMPANLANDPRLSQAVPGGTASHGLAREEVTRLLAPLGLTWSIQNGVFQALSDNEAAAGTAWPVDQAHGMIGSPDFGTPPRSGKPPHVKVKMELYPELTAGCAIDLTSKLKSGRYRVEKVVHSGCNLDGGFTTEIEIQPMQATTATTATNTTPRAATIQQVFEEAGLPVTEDEF